LLGQGRDLDTLGMESGKRKGTNWKKGVRTLIGSQKTEKARVLPGEAHLCH